MAGQRVLFFLILLGVLILAASQAIEQCEQDVDIVFLMDSSGSIGITDYAKQKDFVKQLAASFVISSGRTHAGLMIYSDEAKIEAYLSQYPTTQSFKRAVDGLPYLEKRTRIDKALKRASEEVFRPRNGLRKDKHRIAVILTDGEQTPDPDAVPLRKAVRPLHESGVKVFAIGVGPYYKRSELQMLVQRDQDIYEASDFDNLLTLVQTIARGTCESAKPTRPPALKQCLWQADLAFIMDASNSIGRADFAKEKKFVKDLATTYALNETLTGVITYSDEAKVEIPFQHFTPNGFRQEIDRIDYTLGRTRIDKALRLGHTDLFSQNGGSRSGFPKLLVILTDGVQTPDPDAIPLDEAVIPLRNAGVKIFAVGVGPYVDRKELLLMVENSDYVIMAKDFDDLLRRTHEISERTCEEVRRKKVDGNWGAWRGWSDCSEQACGRVGRQYRRRYCNNPSPANGGRDCSGVNEERRMCRTSQCDPSPSKKCTYQADLGFIMDASASIGPRDFAKEREFVKRLASTFEFRNGGNEGSLAGVITYSDDAYIQIPFGRHRTQRQFTNAVEQIPYILGRTRIDKALRLAARSLFPPRNRNYPKLIIILTDGVQTPDPDAVPLDQAVIPLQQAGITLFGIGVGNYFSRDELLLMVEPHRLFTAKNFDELLGKVQEIANATCIAIQNKVHGSWSNWGSWSDCSRSCQGGRQRRTRTCTNPPPAHGGRFCPGPSEQEQGCNTQGCPVDGGWSSWIEWLSCSKTCGGGRQIRQRFCSNPRASNGGRPCPGPSEGRRPCSQQPCPDVGALKCIGNADLGFLMDASGSIGQTDFQKARDFVKALATSFQISPKHTSAGVITYSDEASLQIAFGRYTSKDSFRLAVDRIPYTLGRTRIDKALGLASRELFTESRGGRANFPKVLVVMTDGVQTPDPDAIPLDEAVIPLRNAGVKVLAIGIGPYVDRNELKLMVESDADLFMASDFDDLLRKVYSIAKRTCSGVKKQTVDGNWSQWGRWSACTKTCGGGTRSRSRACTDPPPSRYGKSCQGQAAERIKCKENACIIEKCFDKTDLGFIMDASGSIGPRDFQKERDFVKAMSASFVISNANTHVGTLTYSDYAEIRMRFGDYNSIDQLKRAIDGIPYTRGRTRIDRALALATNSLFSPSGRARPDVPKIAVILTDGRQTPDPGAVSLRRASEPLRRAGIRVLAVGVGHYVDPRELRLMVDRPGDVYTVKTFDDLVKKAHDIALLSCGAVNPPEPLPPTLAPTRPRPRVTRPPATRRPATFPPETRPPPRLPTTAITGERRLCPNKMDLGFAVASSADISQEDYKRQKVFVRNIAPYMDISNYGNRFGVLVYGDSSLVEMQMAYYRDAALFRALVDRLPFYSQRNRIDKALETARSMFDVPRFNGGYSKVLVLLTHGRTTPASDAVSLYSAVQPLRNAGVRVIVIGVGDKVSFRELRTIVHKTSDVYLETSFDTLLRNTEYYQKKICEAGAPSKENPLEPDPLTNG